MGTSPESLDLNEFDPAYLVTLDEIYHSHWVAKKKRRIAFLHEAINHFWPGGIKTKLIHVTGTNGKGSVIHYLEQGLPVDTGSWTGPHVFDYAERFHINGEMVGHDEIVEIYRKILLPYQLSFIDKHGGEALSFAELGILIALHLFQRHQTQWGLMEVGAGGRYTQLMALEMEACILTNVGEDHPKTLGSELWQRALEKGGIARKGKPFFSAAEEPAQFYVKKTAEAEGAEFHPLTPADIEITGLKEGAEAEFKRRNIALACKVIRHFYPDKPVAAARMRSLLPARFWYVRPNIIADIAHNVNKTKSLADQLSQSHPGLKFDFLIGLSRSRDIRTVFAPLLNLARSVMVTSASYAGQDPAEVAQMLREDFPKVEVIKDPQEAYKIACSRLGPNEFLVLTGSAYMIDQALNPSPYLRHLNASFGRRQITG